eukprot:6085020-Prorocentrum_lima.AAC.1
MRSAGAGDSVDAVIAPDDADANAQVHAIYEALAALSGQMQQVMQALAVNHLIMHPVADGR